MDANDTDRLRRREGTLRTHDVSRAITALLDQAGGLPVAIIPDDVAKQIVAIEVQESQTQRMPKRWRLHTEYAYLKELLDGMFKSGCEQYASESGNPFVLVTAWFFEHVIGDDILDNKKLGEALKRMTVTEVKKSLPAARWRDRDPKTGKRTGEINGGSHVGAVIFPHGSRYPLLLENEKKRVQKRTASVETTCERTSRVVPVDRPAVTKALSTVMPRLPRPNNG